MTLNLSMPRETSARILIKLFSGDTDKADRLRAKVVGKRIVRRNSNGAKVSDSIINSLRKGKGGKP